MRIRTNTVAAILYVLPALATLGAWYVLLFVPAGGFVTPQSTLHYVLTEEPRRLWFYWFLVAPVLWIGLSLAYLTPAALRLPGAIILLGLGTPIAVAAWLTLTFELALFASLPLVHGVKCVREASALNGTIKANQG